MSLLESKSKFNFSARVTLTNQPTTNRPVTADEFFKWSSNHMYRSSYNDMSTKVSLAKGFLSRGSVINYQ